MLQKLPKALGRSQRSRNAQGARGASESKGRWREQGEQAPWVWLNTQGYQRLPESPKASWSSREVPGTQRGSEGEGRGGKGGWGGARETNPLSLTKDPRMLKAFKGSQGFLSLLGSPRSPERIRGEGARGARDQGRARGQGEWWVCYTKFYCPNHLCWGKGWGDKGSKGCKGGQEGKGVRRAKGSEGKQGGKGEWG